jgi:zinc and cadmium transporter
VVGDSILEHWGELTWVDTALGVAAGLITFSILAKWNHPHSHNKEVEGARGIVISEAFHSIIDGAVIGTTYLVNPILGYAATVGIIWHELPKTVGTLTLFRSFGFSIPKTILYGIYAQIGSPIGAMLVYFLGKRVNHESFHALEIASVVSLGVIVLWIIHQEISFHRKHPHDHGHSH